MLFKKLFEKWFSKKPYIRFYTLESGVRELFPIVRSSTIKRNFLEDVQIGDAQDTLSSKNCPGIKKIVNTGWIVTAPADFVIQTNGDGVFFEWAEPYRFTKITPGMDAYISGHTRSQVEPLLDDPETTLKQVVKVETPWRVEASDDVVFLQVPVTYNNESRFHSATGILDPKYAHLINVQLFWKDLNGKTLIRAGTPLCQLIPVARKSLSISAYDVTIDDATPLDIEKEKEFNYASNCAIMGQDSLASRLSRTIAILNKYKIRR